MKDAIKQNKTIKTNIMKKKNEGMREREREREKKKKKKKKKKNRR